MTSLVLPTLSDPARNRKPGVRAFLQLASTRRLLAVLLMLTVTAYWVGISSADLSLTRGHVIGSDGLFYYEYLPSLFLDGDLDFRNQRAALIAEGVPYSWGALHPALGNVTYFAPGWAVLVAPFFLLAHAIALVSNVFHPVRLDGYGFLHESITNFGAVVYGCAGICFVFATLKRWQNQWTALLTSLAVLGASNLGYYLVAQASMAHVAGFFSVAGALYFGCVVVDGSTRWRYALAWGAFSGLAFIVRPQLALCVAPLGVYALVARVPWRTLAWAAAVALAVASIQLAAWYILFGRVVVVPQGLGFLKLRDPQIVAVLFSLRHGLFSWHPVYLLCVLGLVFGRGHGRLRVLALVCIALQVYVNASAADWWAGNAFGLRRFIDSLPFFALGGGRFLGWVGSWSRSACVCLIAALIAWNLVFMIQYRFGYIPRGEAITWRALVTDKARLLLGPAPLPRRF